MQLEPRSQNVPPPMLCNKTDFVLKPLLHVGYCCYMSLLKSLLPERNAHCCSSWLLTEMCMFPRQVLASWYTVVLTESCKGSLIYIVCLKYCIHQRKEKLVGLIAYSLIMQLLFSKHKEPSWGHPILIFSHILLNACNCYFLLLKHYKKQKTLC